MANLEMFPLEVAPDWGLGPNPEADVEEHRLGDGYVFRRPKGINYIKQTWSPQWAMLEQEEAEDTYRWLKDRLNLVPFLWENPLDDTTVQVVCTSVAYTASTYNVWALNATFEQDFTL